MVLRGSAGTGKTSLARAVVRTLAALGRKAVLMAPTGRAAKVFSLGSGQPAHTIHRKIYRQRTVDASGGTFRLNDNLHRNTLFIVDEASMVANTPFSDSPFAAGRLLDDLVRFVYSGQGCRLVLIGDPAQLPPVGMDSSPALDDCAMEGYGLAVHSCDMDEPLRQRRESGILHNATAVRRLIGTGAEDGPVLRTEGFADVAKVDGEALVESLSRSYREVGVDETIVVTSSNKRAAAYNQGIRRSVLEMEEVLESGDLLLVAKNNYYWAELAKAGIGFVANGDRAVVERMRNVRSEHGFGFADLSLRLPDYGGLELQATAVTDCLLSDAPALTREQSERLYGCVMEDYADIPRKDDRVKMMRNDGYFNAMQVKYGYAVTCHKAQGGQWAHVYVDRGGVTPGAAGDSYLRWLYTALTRATEKVFLVNWK